MKIAFLNIYSGINNRGAESFAHELASRLEKNHEVKFFRGADYDVKVIQPEHNSENLFKRFFLDRANLSVLNFTLKIFPQLWQGKFDWVIPMNGFWQVLLCKFLPGKMLITGHSGPGWDERWNLWLKPDVFVATTKPTAQWARKVCPWTRVETIPYGIDGKSWVRAKPVKLDLEPPVILCPAAAVEYKRIDLAIKAVARLEKGSLLHLGTGPRLAEIIKLGRNLLGKRFLSMTVNYQEMPKYYAACNLVTLPSSEQENSPMVFLEAMAANKMVVTTENPRSEWILGSMGVFINPENLKEYVDGLKIGLEKKDFKNEIGRFSWDRIVGDYRDLFKKIN